MARTVMEAVGGGGVAKGSRAYNGEGTWQRMAGILYRWDVEVAYLQKDTSYSTSIQMNKLVGSVHPEYNIFVRN